jgi:hypothetical protein
VNQLARLAMFGLAATRLVRAALYETVGNPIQTRLDDLCEPVYRSRMDTGNPILDVKATVRRERLHKFLTCPHCVGFWVTLGLVVGWRYRWARPFIEALAASTILSVVAEHYPNYDWTAE